jgi:hypothetical protein
VKINDLRESAATLASAFGQGRPKRREKARLPQKNAKNSARKPQPNFTTKNTKNTKFLKKTVSLLFFVLFVPFVVKESSQK